MWLVTLHHPKQLSVLPCHESFVLQEKKNQCDEENDFLRLADSIFCRSVLVLSLLIGFFTPNAAQIRRLAVKDDVCGRVLYG